MNKKGIYLCAYRAYHSNYDIDYNDVKRTSEHINIIDDMLSVDLSKYDYIIATPPCNYWSRANYRRETSVYAQTTKHLLPDIIDKLIKLNKPFLIENVRNNRLMNKYNLLDKDCYVLQHGRHTYWTNIKFDISDIEQVNDFVAVNKRLKGHRGLFVTPDGKIVKTAGQTTLYQNKKGELVRSNGTVRTNKNVQGGDNVHKVIERFLKVIHNE